jgi:hypothetical protein
MTPDTTRLDLEGALGRTFFIPIPVRSRDVIDRRVEVAIAAETARRTRRIRDRVPLLPARRLLVGIAAAVLLAGSVAAGGTLFSRLIAGAPLLEDVWDRATEIEQSTTDAGYTIVLERAAADPERVWVAVSVTAESGIGADIGRMRITDANGMVLDGWTGAGTGDVRGVSASLFGFKVPGGITLHSPFTLNVTSLTTPAGETTGHWSFTFDVPLTPAATQAPQDPTAPPDAP